ncbi:hypothetical protein NON20_19775 [Synechocystis sp. B12]|nr:hypothetical protein NON20_19775 [Synechocystis sp. B12]
MAESLFPRSLYDHLLETKGIFLAEEKPDHDFLADIRAGQVMKTEVESLEQSLTLAQVLPIMSNSHHRGFPVVQGVNWWGYLPKRIWPMRLRSRCTLPLSKL